MNESTLIEALRQVMQHSSSGEGLTVGELSEALDCSSERVRGAVKALLKGGMVRCIRVPRLAMDGCMRPVPAYCVIPKPSKKK